jgi:hypothetical protein
MNNYIYAIQENASKIFDFPSDTRELIINILCYNVNQNAINPFLLFMVKKDENTNELIFPKLLLICDEEFNIKDKLSEIIKNDFTYHGLIRDIQNNYYIVVEIDNYFFQNDIFFVLSTEIINYKKIYNYLISKEIIDVFIKNQSFYLLINKEKNDYYKLPDVCYKYINDDEENYYLNFGNKKEKIFESCDEYYFFNNSINYSLRHTSVIRYALFTGNKIYYENDDDFTLNDYEINKLLQNDKYKTLLIKGLNENLNYPDILVSNYNNFIALSKIHIN